jgi:hypothetical protein
VLVFERIENAYLRNTVGMLALGVLIYRDVSDLWSLLYIEGVGYYLDEPRVRRLRWDLYYLHSSLEGGLRHLRTSGFREL